MNVIIVFTISESLKKIRGAKQMKKKKNDSPSVKNTIEKKQTRIGKPPVFNSVEELEKLIDDYFNYCTEHNEYFTMSGLALFIGIDRKTLNNYSHKDAYFPTIKRAKEIVEHSMEQLLLTKDKPTGIIFSMKNNFGWVDKQEISQDIKLDAVSINVNLSEDE